MSKVEKILGDEGNGEIRSLIISYISESSSDAFNLSKLDTLLETFNISPVKPIK